MDNLRIQRFDEINFADPFFDSLKADYSHGFLDWWNKKIDSKETAFVLYSHNFSSIEGFMYLKLENIIDDIIPPLPDGLYLKIGTFKFNPAGTLRGERFIKKICDVAIEYNVIGTYVTVFDKHRYLINLFERYGFRFHGEKNSLNGTEHVLLKTKNFSGILEQDYPYINTNVDKYLLAIYPKFHTELFPDSILKTESLSIIHDVSHTNSIHKVYISKIAMTSNFKPGSIIVIYRTAEEGKSAYYSAVATSICVVEEVKSIHSFVNKIQFIDYCKKYSVFTAYELNEWYENNYHKNQPCYVIKFTYNIALPKRPIRKKLIEEVGINDKLRWSCLSLTDEQFFEILKLGAVNESLIIN